MTNTTCNGNDRRPFEHEIIQSLLDLEHARVEAKKQIELAHIRAASEERLAMRMAEQQEREELAQLFKPLIDGIAPALITFLAHCAAEQPASGAEPGDLSDPRLDDDNS